MKSVRRMKIYLYVILEFSTELKIKNWSETVMVNTLRKGRLIAVYYGYYYNTTSLFYIFSKLI